MIETKVKIEGMMCAMCEAHVNDAVRACLDVKKVTSSHKKGESVIVSEHKLDETALRSAIEKNGYRVLSVSVGEQERRGLFGFLKK